jgi:hypothetical protein
MRPRIQHVGEYRRRPAQYWIIADLEEARAQRARQRAQADAGDPFARVTVKYFEAKVRDIEESLGIASEKRS